MIRSAIVSCVIAAAPVACNPSGGAAPPGATANACPTYPCASYDAGAPAACTDGVCVAEALPNPKELVLLVAMPLDPRLVAAAMGLTLAVPYAALLPVKLPDGGVSVPLLPAAGTVQGSYQVSASVAGLLGFALGDPRRAAVTSVPVHVTYRPLWSPGSSTNTPLADGGVPPLVDAPDAGLPIGTIRTAASTLEPALTPNVLSPDGGTPTVFKTSVQSSLFYEQTIAPDAPYDQGYPPDVHTVSLSLASGSTSNVTVSLTPDVTASGQFPTFDVTSVDQPLDGWTAYLRDQTTQRVLSPVKPLAGPAGSTACGVLLPTSHVPPSIDPITNTTQLVLSPPAGDVALPTQVSNPVPVSHPVLIVLPKPLNGAIGTITWPPGEVAEAADVVFEATSIYGAAVNPPDPCVSAPPDPGTDDAGAAGDAGLLYQPNPFNFEFTATATALPDPSGDTPATSSYSIGLPRGVYRIIVRPHDAALPDGPDGGGGFAHGVAVFDDVDTGDGQPGSSAPAFPPSLAVSRACGVSGQVRVADGRLLSGATVEALALDCAPAVLPDGAVPPKNTARCLPRQASTTTESSGKFDLMLDPGVYELQIQPAAASALPWVSRTIAVPSTVSPLVITVPAPVKETAQLIASGQNAPVFVVNAIVRMFSMPARGRAIEVGRAVTDVNGVFEMYLDPAVE